MAWVARIRRKIVNFALEISIFGLLYNYHNRKDLLMCTFDYEVQRRVLEKSRSKEEMMKIFQTIGVLGKDGQLTPKYSFIAKYGKKATV